MAANTPWWASLESVIYTKMKTRLTKAIGKDFPKLYCTMSPVTQSAAQFPTVYIHSVDWMESGQDLDNDDIHAVLLTMQIDVIANSSLADTKKVMNECVGIMKSMRFDALSMPIYSSQDNLFMSVLRFRRYVGANDGL